MKSNHFISLYWKCQVIGWSIASLYWGYMAFFDDDFDLSMGVVDFIADVFVGIMLTHAYRHFAKKRKWNILSLKALVPRITPSIVVLSVLYMFFIIGKLYFIRTLFQSFPVAFGEFFELHGLTIFVTGTRLISIWVLAYHLYHYAQREIKTAKENAELATAAKEAQLNNLSAQLNPHFFFNSLNNIKFLVEENPASARRAIDLLSDLLRTSLYSHGDQLITVREELSLVKDYLELEKLRLEERLQVNIQADEEWMDLRIPTLSIQALVENAIKHGIDKRKEGGLVEVKVEKQDNVIKLSVQNPGVLNGMHQKPGIGFKNLKERLRLQYNGNAALQIDNYPGEKVIATISIPAL